MVEIVPSTCTECLVHCGSLLHIEDGQVKKIAGNPEHPVSGGAFCGKGVNAPLASRLSPTRVVHPMRKIGRRDSGQWVRMSWEQAYDEISERLGRVKQKYGPLAIAGAAATFTQSRGTAVRLLLRSLGSPNFMINQDMCHGGRSTAGILSGFSGVTGTEIKAARVVLIAGKSPSESDIVEWRYLQEAKSAGARLIVIDPRRTRIAKVADQWLAPRVGTDAALALSMIHVIFRDGLLNKGFVDEWCAGTEELRERAAAYPPDTAAAITGVAADAIEEAARTFAGISPGCMIMGHGIDAQANAVGTALAFQSLLALTGNIDRPGSNRGAKAMAGYRGNFAFFNQNPAFQLPPERQQQIIGGTDYPLWTGRDSWTQTCHNPSVLDAIMTGRPYPVRAMYISGTNIVCTYPDQERTIAALKELDLLVVASDEMTPTAELADYFLPKTTLLEEEEILFAQGEPCLEMTRKVYEPLGEARTDVEIVAGLSEALRRRGLVEFEVFPWRSNEAFNAFVLENTGISIERLRETGFHRVPFTYEDYRKNGFKSLSGKFEFSPRRISELGLDPLPEHRPTVEAKIDDEFDLILMTGIRSMALHHSRFLNHRWARRLRADPELTLHPETAARLSLKDNDWAWVQTKDKDRRVLLKVKLSDDVPDNVAATGMGWWYPEFEEVGRGASTFNIGAAMLYGPDFDPVSGAPGESRNTVCKVSRATAGEVAAQFSRAAGRQAG